MRNLVFLNPINLKSDNFSTVRLGSKWGDRTVDEANRLVYLVDTQGKSYGTAEVTSCWTGLLADIPALMIECSHDPVSRTWSGVAQILAGIYKDAKVGYHTIVTVLQLKYTGSAIESATPGLILP